MIVSDLTLQEFETLGGFMGQSISFKKLRNMKKYCILLITTIGLAFNSYGQINFGIKGGVNRAYISTNSGDQTFDERDKNSTAAKFGYHAGLFMHFPLTEKLALQPELLFSTQGRKTTDYFIYETHLNYLSLPLLLEIKPFEDFGLIVGPHFNYLLSAKTKAEDGTYDAGYVYDNNWDIGWTGGIVVQVTPKLYLTARYKQGLSTLTKKQLGGEGHPADLNNRNQVIQIGVDIFLHKQQASDY